EQVLAHAQHIWDSKQFYAPQTPRILAWSGVIPVGYAAMGVIDSLNFNLALQQQHAVLVPLAKDALPAVAFLRRADVDTVRSPRLLNFWDGVSSAVTKAEKGDASSSMIQLERYLRDNMSARDIESCAKAAAAD